ncbi:MAG: hypothetical protein ACREVJ_13265 [Gammaproteobacteria bacterium]
MAGGDETFLSSAAVHGGSLQPGQVWADDQLYGGLGNDTFAAGMGSDLFHGGNFTQSAGQQTDLRVDGVDVLGRVDKRDSQTCRVLIQDCLLRSSDGSRGFVGWGMGTDRAAVTA